MSDVPVGNGTTTMLHQGRCAVKIEITTPGRKNHGARIVWLRLPRPEKKQVQSVSSELVACQPGHGGAVQPSLLALFYHSLHFISELSSQMTRCFRSYFTSYEVLSFGHVYSETRVFVHPKSVKRNAVQRKSQSARQAGMRRGRRDYRHS
jgi:hypothetical protein